MRFLPRLLLLLAQLVFLILLGSAGVHPAPGNAGVEAQIVALTNQFRIANGVRSLAFDARLAAAAHQHSEEMLELDYFSHTSPVPGWTRVADRVRQAGVEDLVAGENLARLQGYRPDVLAPQAVQAWLSSPGHRSNLLRPSYTCTGVGIVGRGDLVLITQVFGEPPVVLSQHGFVRL